MGVGAGVEDVAHGQLAGGEGQPPAAAGAAKLVLVSRDRLRAPAQVQGLSQEQPRQRHLQLRAGHPGNLSVRGGPEPGYVAQALSGGQLWIRVDLGAPPGAAPQEQRGGEGAPDFLAGFEAVVARIGRRKGAVPLGDRGHLAVEAPGLRCGVTGLAPECTGDGQEGRGGP